MNTFGYYDPTSVQKAVGIAADKPQARYLAGGQSLLPAMRMRLQSPTDVIDLSQITELRGIRVDGKALQVGAMASHAEVAASSEVAKAIPALAELASLIGDAQVRNRGTLGGSIANNDPAADYPSAVLALGATVHTAKRSIPADEFFRGLFETALAAGELVTSVSFPIPTKAGYAKFKQPASRFAMVGVFVAQTAAGARVAVTGAGLDGVFRVKAMEDALSKNWSPQALRGLTVPPAQLVTDIHATAEYRSHLIMVMAQRAVASAS
jgi:aerobic carbon-monoxide dehydrogenase medium subunit